MALAEGLLQDAVAYQAERDGNSRVASMFRALAMMDRKGAGAAPDSAAPNRDELRETRATLYPDTPVDVDALEELDYYLCSVCGYTAEDQPLVRCPICTAHPSSFYRVA